ncbi:hypothetical protein GDZ25_03810 [Lactobacillus delbrueckii]|nr:hypothetical protein [Lactobacillus delbrueckii]
MTAANWRLRLSRSKQVRKRFCNSKRKKLLEKISVKNLSFPNKESRNKVKMTTSLDIPERDQAPPYHNSAGCIYDKANEKADLTFQK